MRTGESLQGKAEMKKVLKIVLKALMVAGIGIVVIIALFYIVYAFYPKGPREMMNFSDLAKTPREIVIAQKEAVVTGTPWATEAAMSILKKCRRGCTAGVERDQWSAFQFPMCCASDDLQCQ
jgi:hypothetical protein